MYGYTEFFIKVNEMNRQYINFSLNACCICTTSKVVWFVHWGMPALFKYNFEREKIILVREIPNVSYGKAGSGFKTIIEINDKLFLIPCRADNIVVYDIKQDKFTEIELKSPAEVMFSKGFLINGKIYCIPYLYDWIVSVDIDTYDIEYLINWKSELNIIGDGLNIDAASIAKETIFCIIPMTNVLIKFNYISKKIELARINGLSNIISICCIDQKVYVYDNDSMEICILDSQLKNVEFKRKINVKNVDLHSVLNTYIVIDCIHESKQFYYDKNLNYVRESIHNCTEKKYMKSFYSVSCWSDYNAHNDLQCVLYEDDELQVFNKNASKSYNIRITENEAVCMRKELGKELSFYENPLMNLNDWIKQLI